MVDEVLPILRQERRLQVLFLDLNSYFASVEQQERPELRGRPIAVVPVMADTSFVIASSYEAKTKGVKCGTMIRDARAMCPGIEIVKARPPVYVHYHKRVIEAAERVLPVEEVCSIDEMRFRLLGTESTPIVARELALRMKESIAERAGECMTSSIGIAPNAFLAKVATEMQKPNGLVVLEQQDLPQGLHGLKLTDFAGINRRMAARLNASGIFSVEQMCAASRGELLKAFGSVMGEKWWYLLRGFDLGPEVHDRKTMSHSHVLPPNLRNDKGAREVLLRLLAKAAARLRANDLWTAAMAVHVGGYKQSWQDHTRVPPTQDSLTLTDAFLNLWQDRDFDTPRSVGVTFYDLRSHLEFTPSLFDPTEDRSKLSHAVDRVNQKFGKHKVYLASMDKVRHTAEEKIAFNKTWLFSEGKGDNEWIDGFRGVRTD
jgi:DNA polymerase-4